MHIPSEGLWTQLLHGGHSGGKLVTTWTVVLRTRERPGEERRASRLYPTQWLSLWALTVSPCCSVLLHPSFPAECSQLEGNSPRG